MVEVGVGSYSEAIYLQYNTNGQTGFLKIAYSVKISAPHLHLGREMGTTLYDIWLKRSKSLECEDVDIIVGNVKPYLGVALAMCKGHQQQNKL